MKRKKLRKNRLLFIVVCIILIILIVTGVRKALQVENDKKPDLGEITKYSGATIESTQKEPIEKDGIEVKKIEFSPAGQNQLSVKVKLKNNTDQEIDGYFIIINLLDQDKNVISTISNYSQDHINANDKFEFEAGIIGFDMEKTMVLAKIDYLEKDSNKIANEPMILPSDEEETQIPEPTVAETNVEQQLQELEEN